MDLLFYYWMLTTLVIITYIFDMLHADTSLKRYFDWVGFIVIFLSWFHDLFSFIVLTNNQDKSAKYQMFGE